MVITLKVPFIILHRYGKTPRDSNHGQNEKSSGVGQAGRALAWALSKFPPGDSEHASTPVSTLPGLRCLVSALGITGHDSDWATFAL